MLSGTNTTFDLLVSELGLESSVLGTRLIRLLRLRFPVHARSEDDVLSDGSSVERRARRMALLEAKLGP